MYESEKLLESLISNNNRRGRSGCNETVAKTVEYPFSLSSSLDFEMNGKDSVYTHKRRSGKHQVVFFCSLLLFVLTYGKLLKLTTIMMVMEK